MSGNRIASRYARALYRLSDNNVQSARQMVATLNGIVELFKIKESERILRSPVMPADLKQSLFDAAISKAGANTDLKQFCAAIIAAGRVTLFPQVVEIYQELLDAAEGKAKAVVTSAVSLGAAEVNEIKAALASALKKTVEIEQVVNPALLGGFVVRIGNMLLDYSVRTKLDALAQNAVH